VGRGSCVISGQVTSPESSENRMRKGKECADWAYASSRDPGSHEYSSSPSFQCRSEWCTASRREGEGEQRGFYF
jgi:hypothetical protein